MDTVASLLRPLLNPFSRKSCARLLSVLLLVAGLLVLTSVNDASREHRRLKDETLPVISQVFALQHTSMLVMSSINELGVLYLLEGVEGELFRQEETHEMEHVAEALGRFNSQLYRYKELVLRYFPEEVDDAEGLYLEGERLRGLSERYLDAIQERVAGEQLFQLKLAVEISKERFMSMTDEIVVHEKSEIQERHQIIDRNHSLLLLGAVLMVLASSLLVVFCLLSSGRSAQQHQ